MLKAATNAVNIMLQSSLYHAQVLWESDAFIMSLSCSYGNQDGCVLFFSFGSSKAPVDSITAT